MPSRNVGSAAYYLLRFALAHVDGANVHMIAVGMCFTCKNLTYDETFEPATNGLDFLNAVYLKPNACKRVGNLLCRKVEVHIFLKPFIRNIHRKNCTLCVKIKHGKITSFF